MESNTAELSWLDFLLDRKLLAKHLCKPDPDPSPNTLIAQFLLNADKWTESPTTETTSSNPGTPIPDSADTLLKTSRALKNRTLKLMAIQTAAHLDWDLDSLAKLQIGLQNFLMNHILALSQESKKDKFLQCLYHRWVLRTIQSNKVVRVHYRPVNPMVMQQPDLVQIADTIVKTLNPEKSLEFLESTVESINIPTILIPSVDTFAGMQPDWSVGTEIPAIAFKSMLHLDLGVYFLYEGKKEEAKSHFRAQSIPTTNFPYFKISAAKLEGFLASVNLVVPEPKPSIVELPHLVHKTTMDISKWLQLGERKKINSLFQDEKAKETNKQGEEVDSDDEELLPLDPTKIPQDPDPLIGQEQLEMFNCERKLLETSDIVQIKELVIRLGTINMGCSVIPKLFNEWELPVPVQNAIDKVPTGALKDFVHVLVAKSKQHYNLKNYSQARLTLQTAKKELDDSLRTVITSCWGFTQYNIGKLSQMIEWEILLIDIADLFANWAATTTANNSKIAERCKVCIRFLEDPSSEVNPRSEIVEFVLIALINLGEHKFVIKFEESQKRWPFLEFLGLLARACRDVSDKKDASPNYRELWSAVLPVCMNSTGQKLPRVVGKEGILPNRSSLLWVLDRTCSLTLITLFVSLLSRLHNHILDDVALQINTELLHIWPNIIDDVTTGNSLEMKSRVSGISKLNVHQVQDYLFHLLHLALIRSDETLWLKCLGDVHLASGDPALAMKSYVEFLAISTDYFEKTVCPCWGDNALFRKMIKCCETLHCFTQAMVLCQFLTDVDYNVAFGMAQEKVTLDGSDSLYGFIWDLTILEFLVNLHTKRNEAKKRQEAIRLLGLLELNSNNNEEIQREATILRKSQFMRTLANHYIFV